MWSRNLCIIICFGLLCGCNPHYENKHNWYQLSTDEHTHLIDSDTHFITELHKPIQSTYKGDHLLLTVTHGLLQISPHLVATQSIAPITIDLAYNHCKRIALCAKKQPSHCATISACYQDDMLLLAASSQQKHESLRLYRSILWHQGLHYYNIDTTYPLPTKELSLYIKFSDSALNQMT
jgi:hypothetical protein